MIRHMDRTLNSQVASTTDTVKVFMLLQCKSKHGRELFPSTTARSDSDIRWAILTKIKMALPQIFHIYTGPKLTQIPDLHGTQIYTNLDLHRTHIYTAQIYTNPFSHIDSKKPKFTQPNFTQNPNLHKTFSSNFAQIISSESHYQPELVQKIQCPCSRSAAQR